jgi:hypothetical protein
VSDTAEAETLEPPLGAGEIAALNAAVLVRMRDRAPSAARVVPKPPVGARSPRRPLGLAPAGDAVDEPASSEASPPASEAAFDEYADPTVALVVEGNKLLIDLVKDTQRHLERQLAGFENTIGALKNENTALRLILENLRITSAVNGELTAIAGRLAEMACKGPSARPGQ